MNTFFKLSDIDVCVILSLPINFPLCCQRFDSNKVSISCNNSDLQSCLCRSIRLHIVPSRYSLVWSRYIICWDFFNQGHPWFGCEGSNGGSNGNSPERIFCHYSVSCTDFWPGNYLQLKHGIFWNINATGKMLCVRISCHFCLNILNSGDGDSWIICSPLDGYFTLTKHPLHGLTLLYAGWLVSSQPMRLSGLPSTTLTTSMNLYAH